MKKTILSLFSVLLLICVMAASLPVSAEGNASVSVGSASGKAGDTVTVDVNLNDNPGVIAMQLNVGFDEKQLELVSVSNNGVLNGYASPSTYGGSSYTLSWEDALSTNNNNGTGTIATMTFKLKEDCDKAKISISGKGYDTDVNSVGVSGSGGTITNTEPKTTTTTTTTTKPASTTTTTKSNTTTKKSTTTAAQTNRTTTTSVYTRSYNQDNTYPANYIFETLPTQMMTETTEMTETETMTDVLDLFGEVTESTMYMFESTSESTTAAEEQEADKSLGKLSKTKLILIVLMACFAIVGIAVIVSMVKKSK